MFPPIVSISTVDDRPVICWSPAEHLATESVRLYLIAHCQRSGTDFFVEFHRRRPRERRRWLRDLIGRNIGFVEQKGVARAWTPIHVPGALISAIMAHPWPEGRP